MKLHSRYCCICKKETLFLMKLTDPSDAKCSEIEDVCSECSSKFNVQNKLKIKL